jgi:ATP-dependent Lon protease
MSSKKDNRAAKGHRENKDPKDHNEKQDDGKDAINTGVGDTSAGDDFDLPGPDNDIVTTGAAADSSEPDARLQALPRILRYAAATGQDRAYLQQRLVAEINQICPGLPLNAAWAAAPDAEAAISAALMLAAELDRRAVVSDHPELRSLADAVRLISLPGFHHPRQNEDTHAEDHRRVAKALVLTLRALSSDTDPKLLAELEEFAFGWACLPACGDLLPRPRLSSAAGCAELIGKDMAVHRIALAKQGVWEAAEAEDNVRKARQAHEDEAESKAATPDGETLVPAGAAHDADQSEADVVVVRIDKAQLRNGKLKDLVAPLNHIINTQLPLTPVPPLQLVRQQLLAEFPYASAVIDFVLADLVGRTTVKIRPLILVGRSAGGKSRFARALARVLKLHVSITDCARADGAAFGGTDRRWYTAEPCHPLLAIARGRSASPMIVLEDLEKAPTRSDYGRLWDCVASFLEIEMARAYPDPALQTNLDLSHVNYVATANRLEPLPSAIRDRFRVVTFPNPGSQHRDALIPIVMADLAAERNLDSRWVEPLADFEYNIVATHWKGGSIRRLRRTVEAVLNAREKSMPRN